MTMPADITDLPRHPWHESHTNVAELCRYLVKEENWDIENILDLVEKPWHFDAEWAAYLDWQEQQS